MGLNRNVLTTKKAAEYLGLSEYTMRKKARKREIRGYMVGRTYRFLREDLDNWIIQHSI